ncbi:hypothetical protein [Bacteroides ovatus]|uniref:hypothetical protein n=1 Tax=Bacteroides ovatus TaxID=28116 RepID=UPI0022DF1C7E|nr:hypothetical protein [Bacteroides ovatus]UYI64342.1 MAG: hypothetical protein OGM04_02680 [Bacteroides ovatus]
MQLFPCLAVGFIRKGGKVGGEVGCHGDVFGKVGDYQHAVFVFSFYFGGQGYGDSVLFKAGIFQCGGSGGYKRAVAVVVGVEEQQVQPVHGAFGAGSFHIGDIGTGADGGIRDGIGKGEGVVILTVTRLYHLYHVSACAGGEEEGCYD